MEQGFTCIVEWGFICIVEQGLICIVEQDFICIAHWGLHTQSYLFLPNQEKKPPIINTCIAQVLSNSSNKGAGE